VSHVRLYTLGNFTIDDIVRWPDGLTFMGQPGGNALFAALGARMWLEGAGLLARVGRDYPRERLAAIQARGLCLGLAPVDAPTLHDWALYEADGNRQFINHLNSGSNEAMTLSPDEIAPEHLGAEAYHLAPVPTHQQLALARHLKRPSAWLSVDPHYTWIEGHQAEIQELIGLADFFLPSRLEARLILGQDAPEAAARAFAALGPRAVVIKLERDGSLVYDAPGDRLVHVPIYPATVRDTTGAGDAYCGGFLAGYLLTRDVVAAAQHGTVSASYVVEAVGALATPQPDRAEAQARLDHVAARTGPPAPRARG
jgi:ribokinase